MYVFNFLGANLNLLALLLRIATGGPSWRPAS
jgi:hypothetical protein